MIPAFQCKIENVALNLGVTSLGVLNERLEEPRTFVENRSSAKLVLQSLGLMVNDLRVQSYEFSCWMLNRSVHFVDNSRDAVVALGSVVWEINAHEVHVWRESQQRKILEVALDWSPDLLTEVGAVDEKQYWGRRRRHVLGSCRAGSESLDATSYKTSHGVVTDG